MPLFVSHRRLLQQKSWPRALGAWALDSGGFTELHQYGEWRTSPGEYVEAIREYQDQIGNLEWAAPQDWMCEPFIITKTGLSVAEHQRRTIDNYLTLRTLDATLPFIPVLQGWTLDDYRRHADSYVQAGIDLTDEPLVGIGSVCRRQHTTEIATIVGAVASLGLRLHGFGIKTQGLDMFSKYLHSADSMAWSFNARRSQIRLPECSHNVCNNCIKYALWWRTQLLRPLEEGNHYSQLAMIW